MGEYCRPIDDENLGIGITSIDKSICLFLSHYKLDIKGKKHGFLNYIKYFRKNPTNSEEFRQEMGVIVDLINEHNHTKYISKVSFGENKWFNRETSRIKKEPHSLYYTVYYTTYFEHVFMDDNSSNILVDDDGECGTKSIKLNKNRCLYVTEFTQYPRTYKKNYDCERIHVNGRVVRPTPENIDIISQFISNFTTELFVVDKNPNYVHVGTWKAGGWVIGYPSRDQMEHYEYYVADPVLKIFYVSGPIKYRHVVYNPRYILCERPFIDPAIIITTTTIPPTTTIPTTTTTIKVLPPPSTTTTKPSIVTILDLIKSKMITRAPPPPKSSPTTSIVDPPPTKKKNNDDDIKTVLFNVFLSIIIVLIFVSIIISGIKLYNTWNTKNCDRKMIVRHFPK